MIWITQTLQTIETELSITIDYDVYKVDISLLTLSEFVFY